MRAAALRWLWLLAITIVLSACIEEEKLTALILVVDSDIKDNDGRDLLDSVSIDIQNFGRVPVYKVPLGGDVAPLPKRVGLVHRGGPPGPIEITVTGFKDGAAVVVKRQARVHFVPDKVMMLRINLLHQCREDGGFDCDESQTCDEGGCRDIVVTADELKPWVGTTPPGLNSGVVETDGGLDAGLDLPDTSVDAADSSNETPDSGTDAGELMCTHPNAECDMKPGTVCETNLLKDEDHCGGCGKACPAVDYEHIDGSSCVSGVCRITCAEDYGNCDGKVGTGCETYLNESLAHCGACNSACPDVSDTALHLQASMCTGGDCTIQCDQTLYDNCDGKVATGCETNLQQSNTHCGACNDACPQQGADGLNIEQSTCVSGTCEIDTCEAGFDDCDGVLDCERDIRDPVAGDDTMGGLGPCLPPDSECTLVHDPSSGGHDYYFCNTPRTYDEARAKCQAQRFGDLVRIDDDAENSFVKSHMATLTADAWLGASDENVEGVWRWTDTTLQFWNGGSGGGVWDGLYSRWNTGEPGNVDGEEDCARMSKSGTFAVWLATDCTMTAPFVCEVQLDECVADKAKHHPMQCGCDVSDADFDGDGVPDCNDECPMDELKTVKGSCECGVTDTNTDGDSALDCAEECDLDPDKLAPGACGCGTADTNTDGDTEADCIDECDDDPDKLLPGLCGCGAADTDSDNDTVPDCMDPCPTDTDKTDPGVCGCGNAEVLGDADGDGVQLCNDVCPADTSKGLSAGQCGCGNLETDSDEDASADCVDACDYDGGHMQLPCAYSFTPSNFSPSASLFDGATDVTCSTAGTLVFDTSVTAMQTVCGVSIVPVIAAQAGGPELWILPMNSLSVASGVTLRFSGSRPVVLAVANDASISGTIDVGAQNTATTSTPGAGGNVSCAVGTGQGGNGVYNANSDRGDGAGGGGGFGTAGGAGGAGNNGGAGGAAGVVSTDGDLSPLRGGCSGGATATGGNTTGGGAGGGAVQLAVGGRLTLGATAVVTAAGGGGLNGANHETAGGGGGSGGAIFVEAKLLSIDGLAWVAANGGSGAGGHSTSNTSGTDGVSGATNSTARALGGSGGDSGNRDSDGGGGGYGAAAAGASTAGASGTTRECQFLSCGDDGGGGGGGGGGVGRIRVHSLSAPCIGPTLMSPAAAVVCP